MTRKAELESKNKALLRDVADLRAVVDYLADRLDLNEEYREEDELYVYDSGDAWDFGRWIKNPWRYDYHRIKEDIDTVRGGNSFERAKERLVE